MTPEVEAALLPLNWHLVKRQYPTKARWIGLQLKPNGGLLHPDAQAAKVALERHDEALRAMRTVLDHLNDMESEKINRIDLASCPIEDLHSSPGFDWSGRVDAARTALIQIIPGMLQEAELLRWEAGKAQQGGQKNQAAYRVAEAVAEIYVLGLKKRPTAGKLANGMGVSGLFGKVVASVFVALDIKAKALFGPCDAAKSAMTEARMLELLMPEPVKGTPSLFDLYPSNPNKI